MEDEGLDHVVHAMLNHLCQDVREEVKIAINLIRAETATIET